MKHWAIFHKSKPLWKEELVIHVCWWHLTWSISCSYIQKYSQKHWGLFSDDSSWQLYNAFFVSLFLFLLPSCHSVFSPLFHILPFLLLLFQPLKLWNITFIKKKTAYNLTNCCEANASKTKTEVQKQSMVSPQKAPLCQILFWEAHRGSMRRACIPR